MLRTGSPPAFEPCLPTQADRPPSGDGWLHEIKRDGFRLIVRRDGEGVRLRSRNGDDWTHRYPTIAEAVGNLKCRSCIVDSEVVITDEKGLDLFERLQDGPHVKPEAFIYAFDLIELNGDDLRREPFVDRKATLYRLLENGPLRIVYNHHSDQDGASAFAHICQVGWEGLVSKREDSPYCSGRTPDWISVKTPAAITAQRLRSENRN